MKKNKKALMGMLVAMVMSMGAMGTTCSQADNFSMQQISLSTAGNAASTEGIASGLNTGISAVAGGAASYFYGAAIVSGCSGVGAPVAIANAVLGGICTL